MSFDGSQWPPAITLNSDARVQTIGNRYVVTSAVDASFRLAGGEVVNNTTGERAYIADLLRAQIPANSDHWHNESCA